MSERKTTEIKLRVSPEEKAAWQLAAEDEGVGLSELIRREMNSRAVQKPSVGWVGGGPWDYNPVASTFVDDVVGGALQKDVLTSSEDGRVAKSWMFEASKRD